jgi:hypothetical protein
MIPRGTTFEFEYLGEVKMNINNILGNESAAHMGLIHEENGGPKSCAFVPLKGHSDDLHISFKILYIMV